MKLIEHVGTNHATVFIRQFLNSFSTDAYNRRTNNGIATIQNQKINIGFQARSVVCGGSSPHGRKKKKTLGKVNAAFEKHTRETKWRETTRTIANIQSNLILTRAKIEQQLRVTSAKTWTKISFFFSFVKL